MAEQREKPDDVPAKPPRKVTDDPDAPGLSVLGEQEGEPVEPNEPA